MIGILTEKPSAGRNFATALGGQVGTYNGQSYKIVSARGHLYEYDVPENQVSSNLYDKYKSWDLVNLPWNENDISWKRVKKQGTSQLLATLKKELSTCYEIVIATDVDPTGEGELLAWEILHELKLKPKVVSRMYFVDESALSLQNAFINRKVINSMNTDMDFIKAQYRSRWDYMSMQFTRIATKCGGGKAVLRQGRLKSSMVLLVGDGLKAVSEYKKIPYFQNRFTDDNGVMYVSDNEKMYSDKFSVPQVYKSSSITLLDKTIKRVSPPKLLDLASLSAILSSKGYSAKNVLSTYQKLYEAQIVSYPRTEDKTITFEQFNQLLPKIDNIANVVGVDVKLLIHRQPRSTHVKNEGAHGANRPGLVVPSSLSALSGKYGDCAVAIYKTLAINFLKMFAEDYEYECQRGCVTDYSDFIGTCNVPLKMGFKALNDDTDDEEDSFNKLGLGSVAKPYIHSAYPPKPPTPTMKWLMKQLERYDVGTGATRTSTYSEIVDAVKYPLFKEKKGKISMTEYGEMSYQLLQGTCIGDLHTTEQLYKDMKDIYNGILSPDVALSRVKDLVKKDIAIMQQNSKNVKKNNSEVDNMSEKVYYECNWKGKDIKFNRVFRGHTFTDDECERLANDEIIEIRNLKSKTGSTYGVRGKLENLEFNGYKYVGFNQLGFISDNTGIPNVWCHHVFSDDEKRVLKNGESVFLPNCISKAGKNFSCYVSYGTKDDGTVGLIVDFDKN